MAVAVAEACLHAKFHLDPSNRLATIYQRYRQTDRQTGLRSYSIGRTVLQTVVQKLSAVMRTEWLTAVCLLLERVRVSRRHKDDASSRRRPRRSMLVHLHHLHSRRRQAASRSAAAALPRNSSALRFTPLYSHQWTFCIPCGFKQKDVASS